MPRKYAGDEHQELGQVRASMRPGRMPRKYVGFGSRKEEYVELQ